MVMLQEPAKTTVEMLAQGFSMKEIAAFHRVTFNGLKFHVKPIMNSMQCRTYEQFVAKCLFLGNVDLAKIKAGLKLQ